MEGTIKDEPDESEITLGDYECTPAQTSKGKAVATGTVVSGKFQKKK